MPRKLSASALGRKAGRTLKSLEKSHIRFVNRILKDEAPGLAKAHEKLHRKIDRELDEVIG